MIYLLFVPLFGFFGQKGEQDRELLRIHPLLVPLFGFFDQKGEQRGSENSDT